MYVYQRGEGAKRRVMHLAAYNRLGGIVGSLCGRTDFDTSINVPLGQKICSRCCAEHNKETRHD